MSTSSPLCWQIPLFCFLCYLPFSSSIDLATASYFLGSDKKFHAPAASVVVYSYGLLPGQLLFLGSCLAVIASFVKKTMFSLRWPALYLSLTLLVGSGFFGHVVFKQFWVRPRPKQVDLYGGKYPYCPLICPYQGPSDRFLRSLPSGHATMGFYFFAFYFLGKRLSLRWMSWAGIITGILIGGLLSWARLAQGGHFVSDIIVSLLVMWLSAYWMDCLCGKKLSTIRKGSL